MSLRAPNSLCSEMATRAPNLLVHLELHSVDQADAGDFYERLLGWRRRRVETSSGTYDSLDLGGEVGGGIVQCPAGRSLWLPYVQVESVRDATERAGELGARVLLSPREGPAGWRSVVATPQGAEIALWQPKR
jgi:predicted enzyme related to lactoylglutathione lyase